MKFMTLFKWLLFLGERSESEAKPLYTGTQENSEAFFFRKNFPFHFQLKIFCSKLYIFSPIWRFFFIFAETLRQDSNLSPTEFWLPPDNFFDRFLRKKFELISITFDDICHWSSRLFPRVVLQFFWILHRRNEETVFYRILFFVCSPTIFWSVFIRKQETSKERKNSEFFLGVLKISVSFKSYILAFRT